MTQPAAPDAQQGSAPSESGEAEQIDVAKLADKVYRLMLADIRLAAARGARQPEPFRRKEF
jgi:hypothetical protein